MEATECLKRIVNTLYDQGYVFSKGVKIYYNDADRLKSIEERFVEPLNLSCFQGDMYSISQNLPEIILFPWSYKTPRPILRSWLGETQGLLSVVGIMLIPDLSKCDITAVLHRFDKAVMDLLRKYPWSDDNKNTFGTLMCLFSHTEDAQQFNMSMRKYYCSHAFKNTFVSTISIDCEAETLTQGRAGIFSHKWHGGMDVSKLRENIFCEAIKIFPFVDKVLNNVDEITDEEKFVKTFKEALRETLIVIDNGTILFK